MNNQNIRMVLLFAMFFIAMFLVNAWQAERVEIQAKARQPINELPVDKIADAAVVPVVENNKVNNTQLVNEQAAAKDVITVDTDVLSLKINRQGGDLVYLELKDYPESLNDDKGFVLLDESSERYYTMQSGLISMDGPDSNSTGRSVYSYPAKSVTLAPEQSILNVDLEYNSPNGINVIKRYIFERGSYMIRVQYLINNNSGQNYHANLYGRIKRNEPKQHSKGMFGGAMRTYTGGALNTPSDKYKKISFSDMKNKPLNTEVLGGWLAMVEHYFATAIVPPLDESNTYQSESYANNVYGLRFVTEQTIVPASTTKEIELKFYAGPEVASKLADVAPGLQLTIDYGMFWFLCQPIFWLLNTMQQVFGNWGVAIIMTTVLIKAALYSLSATSYKSMAKMRKIQPRIEDLKQRYADDKTQFSQAVMALYKKEKVSPLGGCLPILVQIPIFIALYYVLLEAVQLRQAPFVFWIHDLSAKDPYYVLPIIMGASMLVQQRLNPPPADPMQAKVMMFMPVVFTFLFLQFPAGLVLYWVVNNLLSILQQWYITKSHEQTRK